MRLMINGKEAVIGQEVTTFCGKKGTLTRIDKPHKPSSTGRVYIDDEDGNFMGEYFPGVIGGKWIEREDQ